MSDAAREMLRMYGLGMGSSVNGDARLQKIRELRTRDAAARQDLEEEPIPQEAPPKELAPKVRVTTGSVPAKGSFTTRPRR